MQVIDQYMLIDKSQGCNVFCFSRLLKMSATELFQIANGGLFYR